MFIRAVWRSNCLKRGSAELRKTMSHRDRDFDGLAIVGPDFREMTRGLFDQ